MNELMKMMEQINYTPNNITKLTGGITNYVYKVDNYIVRIYGDNTDKIIDRHIEKNIINELSVLQLAPKIILDTKCGRIEEYFDAVPVKSINNCNLKLIAKKINEVHNSNININKEPILLTKIQFFKTQIKGNYNCINIIDKFLEKNPINDIDVCFCHNDLNFTNILINYDIHLIDYEYASYNYRHYEIANLFCEFMGIDVDILKFPSDEQQNIFLNKYSNKLNKNKIKFYVNYSHIFWALWALYQHENSNQDFNYLKYCQKRINLIQ
jgi:ethanolamine kinase